MRWIDIPLPRPGTCQETDRFLDEARALADSIPDLQRRYGLDTPAITRRMEEAGRKLFQAVTAQDPAAFRPDPTRPGADAPETEDRLGYHLIVAPEQDGLPWHWLHNSMAYLLETCAISSARHGSRVPEIDAPRLWMQRHSDALFADGADAGGRQRPRAEILFVPGHGRDEIRRLIFREAEGIDQALDAVADSGARLRIPGAITPGLLAARAMLYQVLHFAAPTSQPPEVSGAGENRWLASLMAAAGNEDSDTVDELVGMDLEVLGVDPVEAALDQALESFTRREATASVGARSASGPVHAPGWLLDDGPVSPEYLGRDGCLPPLVFSNSWCSLNWLGQRFLGAGASTFVGTSIPVYSRPARRFAALFYGALATGRGAGPAHRQAALALRDQLGAQHPGWLAHGIQGYGALRLHDL